MARLSRGTVLGRRYRVEEALGEGSQANVYRVRDNQRQGACWAVKVLDEGEMEPAERAEAVTLFRQEAAMLASLHHPGLPRVLDMFEEPSSSPSGGSRHILVMQLIRGETLDERMQRLARPYREDEVVPMLIQLASCLHYLHNRPHPIIFRDVKPSNCMITAEERLLLIDFGIARFHKPDKKCDTVVLGTPGFSAPEQYGRAQTDARSDVFSLGVLAWHLLSGADPVAVGFAFPPLRDVAPRASEKMGAIVERCLRLDPAGRYTGMTPLLEDLRSLQSPAAAGASVKGTRPLALREEPSRLTGRAALRWLLSSLRLSLDSPTGLPRLVAVGVLLLCLLPFMTVVARSEPPSGPPAHGVENVQFGLFSTECEALRRGPPRQWPAQRRHLARWRLDP